MAEMKAKAAAAKFGEVYEISKADWVREVTDASKTFIVVAHLYEDGIVECRVMEVHAVCKRSVGATRKRSRFIMPSPGCGRVVACEWALFGRLFVDLNVFVRACGHFSHTAFSLVWAAVGWLIETSGRSPCACLIRRIRWPHFLPTD